MNEIRILICVDAFATINGGQARSVMFDDQETDSGQGTSELTIHAGVGDQVAWDAAGIQADYYIVPQNFVITSGDPIFGPFGTVPTPIGDAWCAQIERFGRATYRCDFDVVGVGSEAFGPYHCEGSIIVQKRA